MNGMLGSLSGMPIVESRYVPDGRPIIMDGVIHTADAKQFVHRIRMELTKVDMREDLRKALAAFAERVGVTSW